MRFAVTRLDLGQTRLGIGWVLYEDEHNSFEETKPRDVKRLIKEKDVMGLKLSEDGETIMVDTDFVKDLASKTGVGNYRYVIHGFNPNFMKEILIVVAKHDSGLGTFYEIVTPFYQRFIVSESRMKSIMNSGDDIIGGVYQDENGDIILKPGVKYYFIEKPASGSDQDLNDAKILLNDGFNDLFEDSGELAEVDSSGFASDDELAEFFGVSKEEMGEILNRDETGENGDGENSDNSEENLPFSSDQAEEAEGQDEQTEPEMHDESLEYAEMLAQREEEATEAAENGDETIEPGEPNAIEELIKEGQIGVTGETSEADETSEVDDQTEQGDMQTEENGDESVKKSKGKRRSKKSDKAEEQ